MNREVYIIGGGTSLKGFDFQSLKDKDTITINNSIFYVPNPTYFISMDYIYLKQRLKRKGRLPNFNQIKIPKFFVTNFSHPAMTEKEGKVFDNKSKLTYDLKEYNIIIKSYKEKGIGITWNDFRHGNNSGHCALQLAILLGYDTINLLGVDFKIKNGTHFHQGYGEGGNGFQVKLGLYFQNFIEGLKEIKQTRPDIKIYNCSNFSRLEHVLPYKEV